MRITPAQYKQALKARYLDLQDSLNLDRDVNTPVYEDDKRLLEQKAIITIARINGVEPKSIREV